MTRHRRVEAAYIIEHGEAYHKMSLMKLLINEKKTVLCVKVKGHHFEHLLK